MVRVAATANAAGLKICFLSIAKTYLDAIASTAAHVKKITVETSVGIPGVVRMLYLAHQKYGKLPWARLFQPAIKLAESGFPVGPKLARTIADLEGKENISENHILEAVQYRPKRKE